MVVQKVKSEHIPTKRYRRERGLDHAGIHFEVSGSGLLSKSETEGPYD